MSPKTRPQTAIPLPKKNKSQHRQEAGKKAQNHLLPRVLILIVLVFAIVLLAYFVRQENEYGKMQKNYTQLSGELETLQQDNARLDEKIKGINSKNYIEEVARQQLGMLKKGEKVFKDGSTSDH